MFEKNSRIGKQQPEMEPPSLENMLLGIAAELGFIEEEKMQWLRKSIAFSHTHQKDFPAIIGRYDDISRDLPEPKSKIVGDKLRVAKLVIMANITYQCGLDEDCLEYLEEAISYADHINDTNLMTIIDRIIETYF